MTHHHPLLVGSLLLLPTVLLPSGTAAQARLFQDLNKTSRAIPVSPSTALTYGAVDSGQFLHLGKLILMSAKSASTGQELYLTDGTEAGTRLVKDIQPDATSSTPRRLYKSQDGKRVFFVTDGTDKKKQEDFWVTDGTAKGTKTLVGYWLGFEQGRPHAITRLDPSAMLFAAWRGYVTRDLIRYIPGKPATRVEIGTPNDVPTQAGAGLHAIPYANKMAFIGNDGKHGDELWLTDGTTKGTKMVKDVASIGDRWGSRPRYMNGGYGRLTYLGMTPTTGFEILTSDGTRAGTTLLIDILPGKKGSDPSELTSIGSRHHYFVSAYDGKTGLDVHHTDGTQKGTVGFDLNPGLAESQAGFRQPSHHFISIGDKVIVSALHAVYGRELFVISNGATVQSVGSTYGSTWMEGTDPVLGKKALIRGGTRISNAVHVIFHGIPTTKARFFGSAGWLHMDILQYIGLTAIPQAKSFALQIPIPSTPALKGVQLIHQSFSFDAQRFPQSLELSNAILWTLGN